jgi:hypothetical protein
MINNINYQLFKDQIDLDTDEHNRIEMQLLVRKTIEKIIKDIRNKIDGLDSF